MNSETESIHAQATNASNSMDMRAMYEHLLSTGMDANTASIQTAAYFEWFKQQHQPTIKVEEGKQLMPNAGKSKHLWFYSHKKLM